MFYDFKSVLFYHKFLSFFYEYKTIFYPLSTEGLLKLISSNSSGQLILLYDQRWPILLKKYRS